MQFRWKSLILVFSLFVLCTTIVFAEQSLKTLTLPLPFQDTSEANKIYNRTLGINAPDGIDDIITFHLNIHGDFQSDTKVYTGVLVNDTFQQCSPLMLNTPSYDVAGYDAMFDCLGVLKDYGLINSQSEITLGWMVDKNSTNIRPEVKTTYYNQPKSDMSVAGTYYEVGDDAKIMAQLSRDGEPLNNATCFTTIYRPDNQIHIEKARMQKISDDGVYVYDLTAPSVVGVYPVTVTCDTETTENRYNVTSSDLRYGSDIQGTLDSYKQVDGDTSVIESERYNGRQRIDVNLTFSTEDICLTNDIFAAWDGTISEGFIGSIYWYNYNTSQWDAAQENININFSSTTIHTPTEQFCEYYDNVSNETKMKINGSVSNVGETKQYYYEDFEDNNNGDFVCNQISGTVDCTNTDGGPTINGSHSAGIDGGDGEGALELYQDLSGLQNVSITYTRLSTGTETDDQAWMEVTYDGGGTWQELESWIGNSAEATKTFDLNASYNTSDFGYRYRVIADSTTDEFKFDDIRIKYNKDKKFNVSTDRAQIISVGASGVVNTIRGGGELNVKDRIADIEDQLDTIESTLAGTVVDDYMVEFLLPDVYSYSPHLVTSVYLVNTENRDDYITNASCQVQINGPHNQTSIGPTIVNEENMSSNGEGIYTYASDKNFTHGQYTVQVNCQDGTDNYYNIKGFRVEKDRYALLERINATVSEINSTTSAVDAYLQNTIYPEIDTVEEKLANVLTNQSVIYSQILDVQQNVTRVSTNIDALRAYVESMNSSVTGEIDENEAKIDYMQSVIDSVMSNITEVLDPKLDSIQNNITVINNDISVIDSKIDMLSDGQEQIKNNLTLISDKIDSVNSSLSTSIANIPIANLTNVTDGVDTIKSMLDCNLSVEVCARLSRINTSVQDINKTVYEIHSDVLSNQNLLTVINGTVNDIYDYMQNNITAELNDNEEKLDEILTNTSNIFTEIQATRSDVQTNYNELQSVKGLITSMNSSLESEINENEQKLIIIDSVLDSVADEINNTVEPALVRIENNLSLARADINTLLTYTDTLESGQSDIKSKLTTINENISILNSSVNDVNDNLFTANQSIHARFDTLQTNVSTVISEINDVPVYNDSVLQDKIDSLNSTLYDVNSTLASLDTYTRNTLQDSIDDIRTVVDSINLTVNGIDLYLKDTIYPEIDGVEENISDVLTNQSHIYDKILEVDSQAESNYNQILVLQSAIESVNQTVKDARINLTGEINENEAKLDSIITTTDNIEDRILNVIEPKLQNIDSNITIIQDKLDDVKSGQQNLSSQISDVNASVTEVLLQLDDIDASLSDINTSVQDSIDAANASLHARFDELNSLVSDVEANLSTQNSNIQHSVSLIDGNMTEVQEKLDCTSSQSVICQKIDSLNVSIYEMNETITEIDDYLKGEVTNYLININATVEDIYPYLQNVVFPKINETNDKVMQVLANQSLTLDNLNTIQGNITQNYNAIQTTQNLIYLTNMSIHDKLDVMNSSIIAEVNENEAYLEDINGTTTVTKNLLNTVIIPQLDRIEQNITIMRSEINNISFNTSGLEQDIYELHIRLNESTDETQQILRDVNASLYFRMGLINESLYDEIITVQDYVDTLESGQTQIISDISSMYSTMNVSFNSTYEMIRKTNQTLLAEIRATNESLYNELITIKGHVDTLENGQQNILDNLDDMYTQMNVSFNDTYDMIENMNTSVLYELGLVNDSLYAELQIIQSQVNNISLNTTDIENLVTQMYTDMNSSFDTTYSMIDDVNSTVLYEIGAINESLYNEIQSVQSDVDSLSVNLTEFRSDMDDLYNDMNVSFDTTYSLIENVNTTLLNELGVINDSVHAEFDTIKTKIDSVNVNITDVEEIVTQMYGDMNSSFDETYSRIDAMNLSIISRLMDVNESLYNEISVVQAYTDTLEQGQQDILASINFSEARIISNITASEQRIVSNISESESQIVQNITQAELNILTDLDSVESNVLESINDSEQRILTNVTYLINGTEQRILTNISVGLTDTEEYIINSLNQTIIENRENLTQTIHEANFDVLQSLNTTRDRLLDAINVSELNIKTSLNDTEQRLYNNMTVINDRLIEINDSVIELVRDLESLNYTVNSEFSQLQQNITEVKSLIDDTQVNLSCTEDADEICSLLYGLESDVSEVNQTVHNISAMIIEGNYSEYFNDINSTVYSIKDYQENLMYPSIVEYFETQTIATLTNMHRVVAGNDYEIEVTLYNPYSQEIDPDGKPELTIRDSTGSNVITDVDMDEQSTGIYTFNYTVSGSANTGVWTSKVRVIIDGEEQVIYDKWNVISNPTKVEVEMQSLCGMEACAELRIKNEGTTAYEYIYNWWTTDEPGANYESSNVADRGQASKLIQGGDTFTRTVCLERPNTNNQHYFRARTFYGEYSFATDTFNNNLQCTERDRGIITGEAIAPVIDDVAVPSVIGIGVSVSMLAILFLIARQRPWELIWERDENPVVRWYNHQGDVNLYLYKVNEEVWKVELSYDDENKAHDKGDTIFVSFYYNRKDAENFMKEYRRNYPDGLFNE